MSFLLFDPWRIQRRSPGKVSYSYKTPKGRPQFKKYRQAIGCLPGDRTEGQGLPPGIAG
ncbi:MAG: hypothetical protein V7670_05145 [Maribacter arcticus]|uniref:hypothetical protein n=1 Tax=Maribacter arcticus TaxID=561365 RepID=UPI0030014613